MVHPTVMPAANNESMLAACTVRSVSVNPAGVAGSRLRALTRKVAICALVTGWSGQ